MHWLQPAGVGSLLPGSASIAWIIFGRFFLIPLASQKIWRVFLPALSSGAMIPSSGPGKASMDWNAAIEKNREALKQVLAMLLAMAGLDACALTAPFWGGRREVPGRGCDAADTPTRPTEDRRPSQKREVEPALTLPRHLHRAALSLLRPAEAAARRLIIVAARDIVVALPTARPRKPKPASTILRNGVGTGIVMPRGFRPGTGAPAPRSLALPLFDPLPRWRANPRPGASGLPRISIPGLTQRFPVPRAPSRDDPIDATRLVLRLGALARALDDLPAQARRFARWRDRGRAHRVTPLRPGRPPGGRLSRYDPDAKRRKNIRDVDEILAHTHALASYTLRPDTS